MRAATLEVGGAALETVHEPAAAGRKTIVFLHEALGSVALWRDFPAVLAEACGGLGWMAYSRQGHGRSSPLSGPRDTAYLDHEALDVLPQLLRRLGIVEPILFGHSDGATIALIHAAGAGSPVAAVVAEAPHVFVEEVSLAGIRAAEVRARDGDLLGRLAKFHDRPAMLFEAWASIWQSPAFRDWSITHRLPAIIAPILAIQGSKDNYGSLAHLDAIGTAASGPVERLVLPEIGHIPHDSARNDVIAAVSSFLGKI
jgi:pimeloyl-ACP methyl ester carboxylesterase